MKNVYKCIALITLFLIVYICHRQFNDHRTTNYLKIINDPPADDAHKDTSLLFGWRVHHVLNTAPCDAHTPFILLVTSYFGNVESRSAMRRAFTASALQTLGIKRVFLLGVAPQDNYTTQQAIVDESDRFGDILQGDFIEAYRNLTYKHLMGLQWATSYCMHATRVLKMDDDIVLDLRKIHQHLVENDFALSLHDEKQIAGYLLKDMTPQRIIANKWFVTKEEYEGDAYPNFISGWFYITNVKTAKAVLMEAVGMEKYFWIDDLLITGILAARCQVQLMDLSKYFTLHSEFLTCCMEDQLAHGYDCPFLVGPNGGDNNLFYKFNQVMGRCSIPNACAPRVNAIKETCIVKKTEEIGQGIGVKITEYRLT